MLTDGFTREELASCPIGSTCLTTLAAEAYEEGDPMPKYIAEARQNYQAAADTPCVVSSKPQLALKIQ
jgi:hypothetical protein